MVSNIWCLSPGDTCQWKGGNGGVKKSNRTLNILTGLGKLKRYLENTAYKPWYLGYINKLLQTSMKKTDGPIEKRKKT